MFPCSADLLLTTETNVLRTVSITLEKDENEINSWSETNMMSFFVVFAEPPGQAAGRHREDAGEGEQ